MKTLIKSALIPIFSIVALVILSNAFAGPVPPPGVTQHGAVVAGNCAKWFGNNSIQDAGSCGGSGGTPGGTSGQIQYNNAGAFGGFTASGDVTVNSGTGATAVVKINGTTVSGTTGSGNVVFSASPTFTGTIIGAAETLSGALSSGNINLTSATVPANGFYEIAAGDIGVAVSGALGFEFGGGASAVNHIVSSASNTGGATGFNTMGSDTNIPMFIQTQGNGYLRYLYNTGSNEGFKIDGSIPSAKFDEVIYTPAAALTPGTTVAWNVGAIPNATLAPVQSFTLSNPSNIFAGGNYMITITQDSTGSRVITWGSVYKFPGGTKFTLSTAASSIDTISCYSPDGTNMQCSGLAAFN